MWTHFRCWQKRRSDSPGKNEEGPSVLVHRGQEVTFRYPTGLSWTCNRCGACCRDPRHRERRILLLESDVERLRAAGEEGFRVEVEGDEPFIAHMRKEDGRCIYLQGDICRVYVDRPLICRMYPFWVEKGESGYIIKVDDACPGTGSGEVLKDEFYRNMLRDALDQVEA